MGALNRKGFTLVELLVVVAILALLAGMLIPVLASAREKSRQTVCASNLKQIGSAFLMYRQEWDENFPAYARVRLGTTTQGCQFGCHWSPKLRDYIKPAQLDSKGTTLTNFSTFVCPSSTIPTGSYAMNLWLAYADSYRVSERVTVLPEPPRYNITPLSEADVKNPSKTVLVYDTPTNVRGNWGVAPLDHWGSRWAHWTIAREGDLSEDFPSSRARSEVSPGRRLYYPRHHKGNNICFIDGHVRYSTRLIQYLGVQPDQDALSGTQGFRWR